MADQVRREAARRMGQAKTPAKQESARQNVKRAREALTPEQIETRSAKVSAAQKARWERYRAEKAKEKEASYNDISD